MPTVRDYFLTASVLREIGVNVRKNFNRAYVHCLFFLLKDHLDFSFGFEFRQNGIFSTALDTILTDLRYLPDIRPPELQDGAVKEIKKLREAFLEDELVELSKVVSQYNGMATYYPTMKRRHLELLERYENLNGQALKRGTKVTALW